MSVKGLDTFFDVLSLLKQPDVFESRLNSLREETKKYQQAVESVAGLQDAQDFIKEVQTNRERTKEELANAHKSAVVIRDAAEKYAKEQKTILHEQQLTLNKKAQALSKKEADINKVAADLDKQESALDKKEQALNEREGRLNAALTEVEARRQKLRVLLND